MSETTPAEVRRHVMTALEEPLSSAGFGSQALPDDFDLLTSGVVDSLGFVELVEELGEHLGLDIDLDAMNPAQMTEIGPLSRHIARLSEADPAQTPGASEARPGTASP